MNELDQQVCSTIEQAKTIIVQNEGDCIKASVMLKLTNGLIKKVKETFTPIKSKIRVSLNEALAQEKKHLIPLTKAKDTLNQAILAYNENERIKQIAQKEEKTKEAVENKDYFGEIEAQTPSEIKKPQGMFFRDNWKVKQIVNETLIPREYLEPNMVKLNAFAKLHQEKAQMAGITFYNDQKPVQR